MSGAVIFNSWRPTLIQSSFSIALKIIGWAKLIRAGISNVCFPPLFFQLTRPTTGCGQGEEQARSCKSDNNFATNIEHTVVVAAIKWLLRLECTLPHSLLDARQKGAQLPKNAIDYTTAGLQKFPSRRVFRVLSTLSFSAAGTEEKSRPDKNLSFWLINKAKKKANRRLKLSS